MQMVIWVFALVFSCLGPTSAAERVVALSPRVGDTLDIGEREYFQLFPRAASFPSVVVTWQDSTRAWVKMSGGIAGDSVRKLWLSPRVIPDLIYFVDHFEELRGIRDDPRTRRLEPLVDWPPRALGQGYPATVVTSGGGVKDGGLLCATPEQLYLAPADQFDFDHAYSVPLQEIQTLRVDKMNLVGGAYRGLAVGLTLGLLVGTAKEADRGEAHYRGYPTKVGVGIGIVSGALVGMAVSWLSGDKVFAVEKDAKRYRKYLPRLRRWAAYEFPPPEIRQPAQTQSP